MTEHLEAAASALAAVATPAASAASEKPASEKPGWPATASSYKLGECIGGSEGSGVRVWLATCEADGEAVAVKTVDLEKQTSTRFAEMRMEVQQMAQLSHANVAQMHQAFVARGELWLVMQLHAAGSCRAIMRHSHERGFDEGLVLGIVREVARGLEYLHARGIIHRNLKGSNILIDGRGAVRVTGFEKAAAMVEGGERLHNRRTFIGSPCWMAPEVLEQASGYDASADVWSLGICALELLSGEAPFEHEPPMKVMLRVLAAAPPLPEKTSKALKELLGVCLKRAAAERPTAAKLLHHRALRELKQKEVSDRLVELVSTLPPLAQRHKQLLARAAERRDADISAAAAATSVASTAPPSGGASPAAVRAGGSAGGSPAAVRAGGSPAAARAGAPPPQQPSVQPPPPTPQTSLSVPEPSEAPSQPAPPAAAAPVATDAPPEPPAPPPPLTLEAPPSGAGTAPESPGSDSWDFSSIADAAELAAVTAAAEAAAVSKAAAAQLEAEAAAAAAAAAVDVPAPFPLVRSSSAKTTRPIGGAMRRFVVKGTEGMEAARRASDELGMLQRAATTLLSRVGAQAEAEALEEMSAQLEAQNNELSAQNEALKRGEGGDGGGDDGGSDVGSVVAGSVVAASDVGEDAGGGAAAADDLMTGAVAAPDAQLLVEVLEGMSAQLELQNSELSAHNELLKRQIGVLSNGRGRSATASPAPSAFSSS